MPENNKYHSINDLGEFGLIEKIKSNISTLSNTIMGIGDDCAVVEKNDTHYTLISTDTYAEFIHFDMRYVPLNHLGYKVIAASVSDIAAMNGKPLHATVSLSISSRYTVEAIEELYKGMNAACKNYNIDIIGGDTTASSSGLVIGITVLGEVEKEKIAYRSGAKKNDLICATGDFGAAYIGLQLLEREKQAYLENSEIIPKLAGHEYSLQRQLKPEARMDAIFELKELNIQPTSMIDVSDGLASEILHICKNSGVGAHIYEEKIPISTETYNTAIDVFKIEPITCALSGGEDYELLFTIDQKDFQKLEKHPDIAIIGYITEQDKGVHLITKEGNTKEITAQGWNHFKS